MQKRGRTGFIVAFLSPALLLYSVFVLYPLAQSFLLSFYSYRGVSNKRKFIGTENYHRLFADSTFWTALKNNLWILVIAGVLLVALGLLLAHASLGKSRGARAVRGVALFPQVISLVVVAIVWMFIFNPAYGVANAATNLIGLKPPSQGYANAPSTALVTVALVFVWYALGFYVMLFGAGLRNIPEEITEAAALDGATGWRRFTQVTWPMLWSVKRVAITYIAINVMNIFALVFILTRGGPDRRSETLLTYMYEQGFTNFQFGYATTIAVANFAVCMALSLAILWLFRRNPEGVRA